MSGPVFEDDPDPGPIAPPRRSGDNGDPASRVLPGLVVAGLPIVIGAWSLLAASIGDGAVALDDAEGDQSAVSLFVLLTDPAAPLLAYFALPLALPPIIAGIGHGSIARWLALAAFCLAAMVIFTTILAVAAIASVFVPTSLPFGVFLAILAGQTWPFFGLECCGCLLAAGFARAREV